MVFVSYFFHNLNLFLLVDTEEIIRGITKGLGISLTREECHLL